jgi:hypothetical protein
LGQPLQQVFSGHCALPCLPWREGWPRGGAGVNRRRAAEFQTSGALTLVEAHPAAIAAVRRERGTAEDALLEKREGIGALGALEPMWDEFYPAEQARILRPLTERIDVEPDGVSVTLHAAGIRSLVAEMASEQETAPEADACAMLEAAE